MLDRTQMPSFVAPYMLQISIPIYEKKLLKNGIPYYFLEDKKLNIFQIEFTFVAGNCFDSKKLTASFTNSLLNNGTKQKTALEIEEYLEQRGAFFKTHCSYEIASITISGLSEYFEELMVLLHELFTESIFIEKEIEIQQENSIQQLKIQLQKSDFLADRKINEAIYGLNHPYGKFGNINDFNSIERNDILSFYEKYYINAKTVLFLSGALPQNYLVVLNENFGKLPWQVLEKKDFPYYKTEPSKNQKINIINNKNASQIAIRLGTSFIGIGHPDYPKIQLLNLLFGGYFGARLMENIREEKGYTYGIYSYIQHHFHQSAFIITSEVKKEVSQLAIEEIHKEIKKLYTSKIQEEELTEAKNYLIGSLINDMDNVFLIMNKWKSFILNELPLSFFDDLVNNIKTTSCNDLFLLADKYFNNKCFYEVNVS
ncbi:MAG: M16 family metallopeptidase [Chitinophagaceae bacterium]